MELRLPSLASVLAVTTLALGLAATGCRTTRERRPLVAPNLVAETSWYVGSTLSGPVGGDPPSEPAAFDRVKLEGWALAVFPEGILESLSSHAPLITASGTPRLLRSTGELSAEARYGGRPDDAEALRRSLEAGSLGADAPVASLDGFVAPGTTIRFVLHVIANDGADAPPRPDSEAVPRIELRVHRRAEESARTDFTIVLASPEEVETVMLPPMEGRDRGVRTVILNSPFDSGAARGLAVVVEVVPAPPPGSDAYETHTGDVAEWRDSVAQPVSPPAAAQPTQPLAERVGLEAPLRLLENPTRRRASLAFLARESGASFAEDLALVAPDSMLEDIARRLREDSEQLPTGDRTPTREELGWSIERIALAAVGEAMLGGDAPDLTFEGMLIRHFGAMGMRKSLLGVLLLEESRGLADFRSNMIRENLNALVDRTPAVRVRAFDWLSERGLAPEGFDPLAPEKERRTSLERYLGESRGDDSQ